MNINDVPATDIQQGSPGLGAQPVANINDIDPSQIQSQDEVNQEKYGTPGQMLKTAAEGAGEGVLGPLSTAAEVKFGIAKPEDIRMRKETNPIVHGGAQAATFAGSLLLDGGIAPLIGKLGDAAAVGIKGASTISKIAKTGVKTGAEMAAISTGDEISKMITQDPNQTVGTAAANVGLSTLLGLGGGAAIGAVSPLLKAAANKAGLPDIIDNAKAQFAFRQANPDLLEGATSELGSRAAEVDAMHQTLRDIPSDVLARAMPEMGDKSVAKIHSQLEEINEKLTSTVEKAADNAKLKQHVPDMADHLTTFQEAITNPHASNVDRFKAIEQLKQGFQALAESADKNLAKTASGVVTDLRNSLEDTKVWGEAANVQKSVNKVIEGSKSAQEDFSKLFGSKVGGQNVLDSNKIQKYIDQALKGKTGTKSDVVRQYLESTQKAADQVKNIHSAAGLEAPAEATLNPTPVLNNSMNVTNHGTNLGNWLFEKGLGHAAGNAAAEGVGTALGSVVGHPYVGAVVGQKVLGPTFRAIAKPLLEGATNSAAMKSAIDYTAAVVRGDAMMNSAVKNIFKAGAQVLPTSLLPSSTSREKLQKNLDAIEKNPAIMSKVGENVAPYLPDHTTAMASTAATALNYLSQLKPQTVQNNMLDTPPPADPVQQQKYDRALDLAQSPLLLLQHAKTGTIQPDDVQTVKTIYPGLYKALVSKVGQELVEASSSGTAIPYAQRLGISTLIGMPVDSTMTPGSIQAIMASSRTAPLQNQGPQQGTHATSAVAGQMQRKAASLDQTPLQARQARKVQS